MRLDHIASLTQEGSRILLLVLDGLGGLPRESDGLTELEAAQTPNLDRLAREGSCGLHEPVGPGITPGSGPGHLALFGYDPLVYQTGRGVLEALGIEFPLEPTDIAIRANFCTVDADGVVTDRRAGRIPTEEAAPIAERLDEIRIESGQALVRHVKEHRFLLVIRPEMSTEADIDDTDPGREGVEPHTPVAHHAASEPAAGLVRAWLAAARDALADEPRANMALLRGASSLPHWPSFEESFGLRAMAVAAYPMYRGVARLVGMEAFAIEEGAGNLVPAYQSRFADYDFHFLHFKPPDKAGEDGDFDRKVAVLEEADAIVPELLDIGADVILVTGDHSTPSALRSHSWHPVPFLIHGGAGRADAADYFGETACGAGSLGLRRGHELMPLAMARAGRLAKFGA